MVRNIFISCLMLIASNLLIAQDAISYLGESICESINKSDIPPNDKRSIKEYQSLMLKVYESNVTKVNSIRSQIESDDPGIVDFEVTEQFGIMLNTYLIQSCARYLEFVRTQADPIIYEKNEAVIQISNELCGLLNNSKNGDIKYLDELFSNENYNVVSRYEDLVKKHYSGLTDARFISDLDGFLNYNCDLYFMITVINYGR